MSPANAYAAYRTAEVETISQRDLIVKLYQGAERFLRQTDAALEAGDRGAATIASGKARRIFTELLSTLNLEQGGEIAARLQSLYVFFIARSIEATVNGQPQMIRDILPIIADLRGAWEQIPAEHAHTSSISSSDGHTVSFRS